MTTVNVSPRTSNPSHHISLSNGESNIGLIFNDQEALQEFPISEPSRPYAAGQKSFIGGSMRGHFADDPTGFADSFGMWWMTDGKLFPGPLPKFAKGYRDAEYEQPGSVSFQTLLGAQRYVSRSFTATASSNRVNIGIWLSMVGAPAALTVALYSDSAGSPNALLQSSTVAAASANIYGIQWVTITSQAVTSGTTYHVVVYAASTDNEGNHWRVATNASGSSSKISSAGSSWSAPSPTFSMYYRVTDSISSQRAHFFTLLGASYAVIQEDDLTAPRLFIIGDRGKASAATSSTLTDSASGVTTGWTTDIWVNAYVRIVNGTGDGQIRLITANTSTQLTVSPDWDKTPSTDSEYVIYGSDVLQEITGHGLTLVTGRPTDCNQIVYFPQGQSVAIRKMRLDYTAASRHEFTASGSNKADLIDTFNDPDSGNEIWAASNKAGTLSVAQPPVWTMPMTFRTTKNIGPTSWQITNVFCRDKVYVFKEESFWQMNGKRPARQNSGMESYPDPNNGTAATGKGGELWFSWAHSVVRGLNGVYADMLNYRPGAQGVPSNRKGPVVAAEAAGGWVFIAIDGGTSNRSSILAWNGMGWGELFRSPTGKRIRALYWQPNPSGRPRLWCDVGGDLVYFEFPQNTTNPLLDTSWQCNYFAELITTTFDANEPALYKLFQAVRVTTDQVDTTGLVEIDYQINGDVGTDTWYPAGSFSNLDFYEFEANVGEVTQYRLRLRLYTTSATTPPVVTALESVGWLFSRLKYQWAGTFKVGTHQRTLDFQQDFDPDYLLNWLKDTHERGLTVHMSAVRTSMNERVVALSAPAAIITTQQLVAGKYEWDGYLSVALREA